MHHGVRDTVIASFVLRRQVIYSRVLPSLMFDAMVEVGVLSAVAYSGLGRDISGFCTIAALIVAFDFMFMFTLFLPVLTLHMEVCTSISNHTR